MIGTRELFKILIALNPVIGQIENVWKILNIVEGKMNHNSIKKLVTNKTNNQLKLILHTYKKIKDSTNIKEYIEIYKKLKVQLFFRKIYDKTFGREKTEHVLDEKAILLSISYMT